MANILFQQHKGRLYTWTSPGGQYRIRLIIFFADEDREALHSQQKQDHKLLIAKFRLKLEKVGKTTRQFRYDLNQIPYDYTVEVTNRCKGLELVECLKNYAWRFVTLYRRP